MNVSAHLVLFEQEMRRLNLSEMTISNYVNCLSAFFNQSKSDHPKNIHESEIRQYLCRFSEPNTQRAVHSAIKKFYEICLGQKDKFKYIPYAKKSHKLPIVLSVDEIQKMFSVCKNIKHKVILALLYSCGLRVSELINLKWCNIDRSRMVINIIQAKGKKDRQVMLAPGLIPLLVEYYMEYKTRDYVLAGQFGGTYSERSVGEVVKGLARAAGIRKRIYTHLMRHCSFTHMVENGTDINLIQRIAGHSSPKTTAIYTHISHNLISKINSPLNSIAL
jgi:site-specific recombinase XerD